MKAIIEKWILKDLGENWTCNVYNQQINREYMSSACWQWKCKAQGPETFAELMEGDSVILEQCHLHFKSKFSNATTV